MTDTRLNTYEIYALLYGLCVELATLPYEQYPNVGYELEQLCAIFAPPSEISAYWLAMDKGLLKWQSTDAKGTIKKLRPKLAPQIEQYKKGDHRVLGFLIGQLVKEGCDPIEARDLWVKELEKKAKKL